MGGTRDQKKYRHWLKRIFLGRFLKSVLKEIENSGAKKILDLGCGEGYPDAYFLKNLPGIKLTGMDKDEKLLANARKRNPSGFYQVGDINQPPFKNNQFELVLVMEVLEHLKNPEKVILQAKKVAPRAIYTVPSEPWFSLFSFLSGSYLLRLGRHPEHLNFWNKKTFKSLLSKFYLKVEVKASLPWLIAVCQN